MGKKSTPKAPAAPDYAAAATAQGQANIDASRTGAELTNTNQVTPYGSQTFTKNPGSDQWTSTVSLSPDQQRLYDLQTQGDLALGQGAVDQLGRVKDAVSKPLDTSGAPDRVNSVSGPNYSMYTGDPASMQRVGAGPNYQTLGAGPNYQTVGSGPTYDKYTKDIANLPDYGAQAQEVEDSLYHQATAKLDPEFAQAENKERQRLNDAGVAEGSEQFNNSMDAFNRNRTASYGDARDRAIQARGAEQSRLNNDFYTGNAQQFGQEMSKLGYNNDADARSYADQLAGAGFNNATNAQQFADQQTTAGFNNATNAQKYADAITGAGFNNNASQQEQNAQLNALGFNNNAQGQQFNDSVTAGNFQNQQRGAAIDEAAYLRNDPLNMYNALATGSQVTNPQFRGTGQVATPNAAPTFAATQAQDQRAVDLYNAQLAQAGSAQSGLFGMAGNLGSAAISKWSDRRLKRNIRKIGALSTGLSVYQYEIFGQPEIGVMADEVRAIHPHAVTRQANGYDMVDYSKVAI